MKTNPAFDLKNLPVAIGLVIVAVFGSACANPEGALLTIATMASNEQIADNQIQVQRQALEQQRIINDQNLAQQRSLAQQANQVRYPAPGNTKYDTAFFEWWDVDQDRIVDTRELMGAGGRIGLKFAPIVKFGVGVDHKAGENISFRLRDSEGRLLAGPFTLKIDSDNWFGFVSVSTEELNRLGARDSCSVEWYWPYMDKLGGINWVSSYYVDFVP